MRWLLSLLALVALWVWTATRRCDRAPAAAARTMRFAKAKYTAREARTLRALHPRIPTRAEAAGRAR